MADIKFSGPSPDGKVLIFGQEAFHNRRSIFGDVEGTWEASLFPFTGTILKKVCNYEWVLKLHNYFNSRHVLGRGLYVVTLRPA